ncbi:hypothetical protein TanjilG_12141 [Lupinus angustifolius]|uniref:Uncharacterized protein n=1 Tax=Lupinus angustifolius TaxID=3871 RepID=A0A1J7GDU3_LUPAN|nr:PREDICTED: protein LURP1-like [Lupinus angustifolius]OIV98555.1 hypothetical protein TanjilG_12141 [Lupinus angustifolius]
MSLSCMEDLSDVFEGGYNSGYTPIIMKIDMEDGAAWSNKHTFVMEEHFSHHRRRVLLDASSHEYICTMRKKKGTLHGRWKVYKGEYNGDKSAKLCFIVKRPSIIMSEKCFHLDIFLAKNTEERVCKVNVTDDICEIIAGPRSLAKTKMEGSIMEVMIEANVDLALIVSVLVILDEIKHNKLRKVVKGVTNTILGIGKIAMLITVGESF